MSLEYQILNDEGEVIFSSTSRHAVARLAGTRVLSGTPHREVFGTLQAWNIDDGKFEEEVGALLLEVGAAFSDVEADFPEVEAGWEHDVARSVVSMSGYSESVQCEVLRALGLELDDVD